ncbi:MAG TPA: hypothetical protein DC024_11115, partial [Clostridiales bacterium]|nr:hypothetical protein [Clostridiales bacterium]
MRKIIGFAFATLLLFFLLFQAVLAVDSEKQTDGSIETLQVGIEKMDPENELIDQRSEYRRSFRDKQGKLVTFIATSPLNYLGDDNQYYPIETNIVAEKSIPKSMLFRASKAAGNEDADISELYGGDRFRYHAVKNTVKAHFANESDGGVVFEYQNKPIFFQIDHQYKRSAKISNNTIRYEKIFDNCDLEYTVLPGGIKDELIFYSLPEKPILSFKVDFGDLKSEDGPEGSINLVDNSGNVIYTIHPSLMFEKENAENCIEIETRFHRQGAQLYCDLVLDMGWLRDKHRKYPVVVDPLVSVGELNSFGKEERRFLFYAPESYGTIKCEIKIDGPGYHGELTEHNPAKGYFKDLTAKKPLLSYDGYHDWHKNHEENLIAGHSYEVYIYGGRSKHKIGGKKFYGRALATITYGDSNGCLFAEVPPRILSTTVHKNEVEKVFELIYPQTISYTSNSGMSAGFRVYQEGEETPIFIPSSDIGVFQLNAGPYKVVVPQNAWAELMFPRLTANYESRILMRGNPGIIDSTFTLPSECEVKMQFKTAKNGSPSSMGYPSVKILSGSQTLREWKFDVNYYNYFDGGDKVLLKKEVPYRLIVSRGHSPNSGWGSLELDLYHPKNEVCKVTNLGLIDSLNNPVKNRYANGNHRLRFNYTDPDGNPLKEYKLTLEQTNSTNKYEYWLSPLDGGSGSINIPYSIRQFNFDPGSEILCQVAAWDGFDLYTTSYYNFTLDLSPPVVDKFQGEVNSSNNSIDLECQVRDLESGLRSNKISWTVNGKPGGSHEFSQSESTFSIPDLPWNARVVVTMEAIDNSGNKSIRTLVFYTYPQKATLLAPKQAQSKTKAELKISKVEASLLRVERYIKFADDCLQLDYDTGYMDPSQLGVAVMMYPQISLDVQPVGSDFMQPADIILSANAFDLDGRITKVLFFNGSKYLGTVKNSPYHLTVHNLPVGEYQFTARAIDDSGLETESSPVKIKVKNSEPTVFIKNIKNNQSFTWPTDITIQADAIDQDGTISKVEFYAGNTYIGAATQSQNNTYSIQWNNVPLGIHTLVAKATDNNDAVTSSAPVTVTVSLPPLGSYNLSFNCWKENSGVKNTFKLYLPAERPAPGNHSYGPLGWGGTLAINSISNVKTFPCKIRVNYVVTIKDNAKRNLQKPYFSVNSGSEQLLYINTYNTTKSGSFEIPANSYINITYNSGNHDDDKWIGDDEDRGYDCSCNLTFDYILEKNVSTSTQSISPNNNLEIVESTQEPVQQRSESESPQELVYSFPEPVPARSHETYVYRIYTKNGDKVVLEEREVPVSNNPPKILNMEPVSDLSTYSYHTLKFRLNEVVDEDGDSLTYTYKISGKRNTGEDYTYGPITRVDQEPFTVTNLPDGNYTWTVQVKDEYQGLTEASGKLIVDKGQPVASFNINGGKRFTNDRSVTANIEEAYNVHRVRFSYDNNNWMSPVADWNNPIHLTLPGGEGKKTIYMQAQTEAQASIDTWGPPVTIQRSIILDTTPPAIDRFNLFNQGGTNSVYFRWGEGNDILSGIAGYKLQQWNGLEWTGFETDENRITVSAIGYNIPVKVRIQLIDQAGNNSEWIENIGYTKAAPGSLNLTETTSGYTPKDGHYINLKLNPAEGTTKYKLICVENSGGGDIAEVDMDTLSYKDTTLVPHGVYKYKIQTFNSSGEITEAELEPLQVANIAPKKPTGVGPKGYITSINGVTLIFDTSLEQLDVDGDPLDVKYFLGTDGISYAELPNGILNNLDEGQDYFWKARLDDGYGGVVETDSVSFTVDITPPMINVDNISFDWAQDHRVLVNATDDGSGIADLFVNGVSGDSSREVLINHQGANPLSVTAIDRAGNTASFSHIFYVDRTPPVTNNLRFDLPAKNGKFLAGSNLVPAVWEGTDPETGIKQFKYAWSDFKGWYDPNEMQSVAVVDRQGTFHHNFLGHFEDGQSYYLYILAENRLGLASEIIKSPPLLYDHTGPIVNIEELTGGRYFNGYYYLSYLENMHLTIESNDPHTGINKVEYALTETANPEIIDPETVLWFDSLDELKYGTTPVNGKVYYLAIRATNGIGLTTTVYSNRLVIDSSPPEITIADNATQNDRQIYFAQVNTRDQDTMVIKLEYAIGSAPGDTDLSKKLPGADANGWLTCEYPTEVMELRQHADIPVGASYYFTVKAINICGGVATATSAGTKVIAGDRPVVRDDGSHTSEKKALHFEWTFPNSPGAIQLYEYRIRSDEGVVKDWTKTKDTSLIVTGLELQHNYSYYCDVRATFEDGRLSPVGTSDGILVDLTLPEITEFIYPTYSDGNGLSLTWAANDPESGVKC